MDCKNNPKSQKDYLTGLTRPLITAMILKESQAFNF